MIVRNTSEAQAYDLSLFENREPRMRVIKNEKPLPQKKSTPAAKILLAAVIVILAGMMLYSRVQLVELGDDLRAAKTELESTRSETTRLNMQVESKMSLAHVEEYAQNTLGLVKVDNQQVEYVSLNQENKVYVAKNDSPAKGILGTIGSKIKEYLGL
ncbi:hypothetical protein KQI11_10650 [Acetanaerobacterium sp. MSJ-12]|uniref:Cell division protein FtsL n=1 Tax=Bittarella massiliensis (ex Durand et al. 2017) TaxID=1720313 RepID=A0AAW5KA43_9FIRM|nr:MULTISPECIES: hypothetical protein [Oscillospiraceae]MBC2872325.1 hypothetical protein [Bittarella massiliensis (ex Durand et al. 2017)]MBU5420581.1 hypothetical protein [Acetanaerobacterium sp. MSJ-12]MCQ4949727.1 hypothetical protein [Bittarella massiliensis (ex Durand et al. 2017)]